MYVKRYLTADLEIVSLTLQMFHSLLHITAESAFVYESLGGANPFSTPIIHLLGSSWENGQGW